MYFLTYVSSIEKPLSEFDLNDFVTSVRETDQEEGVTGLLVYSGKNFIHLLEGEEAEVKKIFNTLYLDKRHFGLTVLLDGEITNRLFDNKPLEFRRLSDGALFTREELAQDHCGSLKVINDLVKHLKNNKIQMDNIRTNCH